MRGLRSGTIDADGVPLAWSLEGDDGLPVLMFSNSLGTDRSMWDAQIEPLRTRFRILRYDTRGHGASGHGAGSPDIGRFGLDVLTLLDALGLARVHFCGLSLGGMTGMWLGINAPARIERLVLANTAARVGTPAMWDARAEAVEGGGMAAVAEAVLQRWFTTGFLARNPPAVEHARRMLLGMPPSGYAQACRMLAGMDQRDSVDRITAPTLVIVGRQDAATPPEDGRYLAAKVQGAQLVAFDAAHLSNLELPAPFVEALIDFLTNERMSGTSRSVHHG